MKKIRNLVIAISVILINSIFIINVFGDGTFKMSLTGNDEATKGNNITLSFNVDPSGISSGLASYGGTISYDKTKLEFVSIKNSVATWAEVITNPGDGSVRILASKSPGSSSPVIRSSAVVSKLTFKVKSDATVGATAVTFTDIEGSDGNYDVVTASSISKNITIKEKEIPPTPSKSSDATLKSLTVTGYELNPAFTPNTTSGYKITVPNNIKSLDIKAVTNHAKAKVTSIKGNTSLSVGKNNVIIEVQAEDGSKKVYTIEVTRNSSSNSNPTPTPTPSPSPSPSPKPSPSPTKSSNNRLKSISGIDGLGFSPDKTEYTIEVPNEITSLDISAVPESSKAKATITNGKLNNLKVGVVNTIVINVKAEDGSVRVYTINVKRGETKSETDLEKLVVNDEDLLGKDDGTGVYNVTVPSNTDTLDITAIPKSPGSTVRIKGNTNLKNGNNKVVVEVTDKNGYTKSYTINVRKEPKNAIFDFIDKYWFILLILPLIIMIYLIRKYFKNEDLIRELDANQDDIDELKALEKGISMRNNSNNIDNDEDIYYNSNDRISKLDKTDLDELINDDSITDFEVKLAGNGKKNSKNIYKRK